MTAAWPVRVAAGWRRWRSLGVWFGAATGIALLVHPIRAQETSRDDATLAIVVVDPTGAVIPHARVVAARAGDAAAPAVQVLPLVPASGIWTARLAAGEYVVAVEADGFVARSISAIRLRGGDSRRVQVALALAPLLASVEVERPPMTRATDPRGFSTLLTPEQIDALPDSPEELVRVLRDLAPPGAIIRIDGFTGGVMPPKSQILSVRIPRLDTFAAQEHGGLTGFSAIDVVTRPGGGTLQGSLDTGVRHGRFNARNALARTRVPESQWSSGIAVDGPIARERASFAASVRGTRRQETATVHAVQADGDTYLASVVRPVEAFSANARGTVLLAGDRTLRLGFTTERTASERLGIGDQNLPARGYGLMTSAHTARAAFGGAWGRRGFVESRLQLRWSGSRTRSDEERPTIRVLDAFTDGGAQVTGASRAFEIQVATDVDYAARQHALRAGILVDAGRYGVRRPSNYLGTFTFESLSAFAAGAPSFFTQRMGAAAVRYDDRQVSAYLQDDYRLARGLLLSYGLRYEWQNLMPASAAWLPRASLTWAPHRSGRTTTRVSWGRFSEWMPASVHEQRLLVDGITQWDVRLAAPSYPNPDVSMATGVRERLAVVHDARRAMSQAVGGAVEHQASSQWRLTSSVTWRQGRGLLRGRNLNPMNDGRRRNPQEGNVIEAVSDGALRGQTVTAQAIYASRRRAVDIAATYVFNRISTNTAGAFTPPAVDDSLAREWAPAGPAHALTATIGVRWRSFTVTLTPRWRSGTPYTVLAGDLNGDGLYLERASGAGRGEARTPPQSELAIRIARGWAFGPLRPPSVDLPAAGMGGAGASQLPSATGDRRFRVELFAAAQNVLNRANYLAIGNMIGTPLFERPLAAGAPRTIDLGARVSF